MRSHGPKRVKKLAGTTALVTGGAVRVGRAIALAPAIQGNAVGPGVVRLPGGFPPASRKKMIARIPMGRHGAPDDVALAVCFFAACPRDITGQLQFVEGGATTV